MTTTSTLTGNQGARRERTLVVVLGDHVAEHALPEAGVLVLGRDSSADVVIDHPTLSRKHAKLTISTHVTIEDAGSRNGTVLGGRKLGPGEIVLVAPGAAIEVGDAMLVLRTSNGGADLLGSSAGDESRDERRAFERKLARIAATEASVLVAGENGTGKTFIAERLHALSVRQRAPFVALRCHPAMQASEVLDAVRTAERGFLYVHEPSLLAAQVTAVLSRSIAAAQGTLRTVTATTQDLARLTDQGTFPRDLLDQLATLSIVVPPLRARLRELPLIVEELVAAIAAAQGRPPPLVSADALTMLGRHTWPGNIRELKNALTHALTLGKQRVLTASQFSFVVAPAAGAAAGTLSSAVSDAEHRRILEVLRECSGNQTRAAKMLGVSRGTLISRLERYAIARPRK